MTLRALLASLTCVFVLAAIDGCGSVNLSGDAGGPDGGSGSAGTKGAAGSGTGSAGTGTGTAGTMGAAGTGTGAAGTTGAAGANGVAGTTGAAGHGGAGASGTGGRGGGGAGTMGGAGTSGAGGKGGGAGTTGAAGTMGCGGSICNLFCQYGNVRDANGCAICQCLPPPACLQTECGMQPLYAQPICMGGIVIDAKCTRGADGKCAWRPPTCSCPALACPDLVCPAGYKTDAAGCPTCGCNPLSTM